MTSSQHICWVKNSSVILEADKKKKEQIYKHVEGKQPGFYINIFILKMEKNKFWLAKKDKMKSIILYTPLINHR